MKTTMLSLFMLCACSMLAHSQTVSPDALNVAILKAPVILAVDKATYDRAMNFLFVENDKNALAQLVASGEILLVTDSNVPCYLEKVEGFLWGMIRVRLPGESQQWVTASGNIYTKSEQPDFVNKCIQRWNQFHN